MSNKPHMGNSKITFKNNINASAGNTPVEYQASACLLYTSPSPRDGLLSRMPSSA